MGSNPGYLLKSFLLKSPTLPIPPTSNNGTGCVYPDWANDAYCDDANNVPSCNYDGGACCGKDKLTYFCTDCECSGKFFIIKIRIFKKTSFSFSLNFCNMDFKEPV